MAKIVFSKQGEVLIKELPHKAVIIVFDGPDKKRPIGMVVNDTETKKWNCKTPDGHWQFNDSDSLEAMVKKYTTGPDYHYEFHTLD